jgi:Fic family protein
MRKTDQQRDSRPASHQLYRDPQEKADLEARNGLLQFDHVLALVDEAVTVGTFKLRPSTVQTFQRIAIKDIYTCAGNYRTGPVFIEGTSHQPPPPEEVPAHVEALCDYVNDHWSESAIHLASYVMWRVNWVHPFMGGNGRTSRAASYLVLCARLRHRLPGRLSIAEQIVAERQPYYEALDQADAAWEANRTVDVSAMEALLSSMLAKQLLSIHQAALAKA